MSYKQKSSLLGGVLNKPFVRGDDFVATLESFADAITSTILTTPAGPAPFSGTTCVGSTGPSGATPATSLTTAAANLVADAEACLSDIIKGE